MQALARQLASVCATLRRLVLVELAQPASPTARLVQAWQGGLLPPGTLEETADALAEAITFGALAVAAGLPVPWFAEVPAELREPLGSLAVPSGALDDHGLYGAFLHAYRPALRQTHGVFATPMPLVRAQVRLAADVLMRITGSAAGFGDPRVGVLDPAVGDGAYLLAVISEAQATATPNVLAGSDPPPTTAGSTGPVAPAAPDGRTEPAAAAEHDGRAERAILAARDARATSAALAAHDGRAQPADLAEPDRSAESAARAAHDRCAEPATPARPDGLGEPSVRVVHTRAVVPSVDAAAPAAQDGYAEPAASVGRLEVSELPRPAAMLAGRLEAFEPLVGAAVLARARLAAVLGTPRAVSEPGGVDAQQSAARAIASPAAGRPAAAAPSPSDPSRGPVAARHRASRQLASDGQAGETPSPASVARADAGLPADAPRLAWAARDAPAVRVHVADALASCCTLAAPVLVCLGNPPYRRGRTRPDGQLEAFTRGADGLGIHLKNVHNVYVAFWRWALRVVLEARAGPGLVSFVTPASFLTGPGFAGMRAALGGAFDELWVLDLGGDQRGARPTENVFPIRSPVAVAMGVRYGAVQQGQPAAVWYTRLDGSRQAKLDTLASVHHVEDLPWSAVAGEPAAAAAARSSPAPRRSEADRATHAQRTLTRRVATPPLTRAAARPLPGGARRTGPSTPQETLTRWAAPAQVHREADGARSLAPGGVDDGRRATASRVRGARAGAARRVGEARQGRTGAPANPVRGGAAGEASPGAATVRRDAQVLAAGQRVLAGAPFIARPRGAYHSWPKLTDIFPLQLSGCQLKRTWPIGPDPAVLLARWASLLERTEPAARLAALRPTRDRDPRSRPPDLCDPSRHLEPLADLPPGAASVSPVPYAYRSFDRQWVLPDSRLGDFLRPRLWRLAGPRQLFVTSLLSTSLGPGPAAVVTDLVPDLDHFRGSFGARAVMPLWLDAQASQPNVDLHRTDALAQRLGTAVTADDLLAVCYALLANPGYVQRFHAELSEPGPRVPLPRHLGHWQAAVALGRQLIWLHTFGARAASPDWTLDGPARCRQAPSAAPDRVAYRPADHVLEVGDGSFGPVSPSVWAFGVSGLGVVRSWLRYRMAAPKRRTSPLDDIRPLWTARTSRELLELLWVLEATLALRPALDALLDEVVAGGG